MTRDSRAKQPFWWRLQYVLPAVLGVATLLVAVLEYGGPHTSAQPGQRPPISPSPSGPAFSTETSTPSSTSSPGPSAGVAGTVTLGRDLQPVDQTQCRSPNLAQGAAWQFGEVRLAGRAYPSAYYCDLFPGGVGSIDFILGKAYRHLSLTVGFADTSESTNQTVKFHIVGDGKYYLTEPTTIHFGDAVDLHPDVTGITRLELQITELSPPGGSGAPSQPALAGLALSP